jgi:exodeoxyribonuclease V alpha subunit
MDSIDKLLDSLSKTKFRGSFHLNKKMIDYVNDKGIDKIEKDTIEIITKRLKVKLPNDGKQTPMKQVHPTFIGMHATGCCCRGCLNRIHHMDDNKELSDKEIEYIKEVIIRWIKRQL